MKKELAPVQEKTAAALRITKNGWRKISCHDLTAIFAWRGQVSKELAFRPRFDLSMGRNHEAERSRLATNDSSHLRNGTPTLQGYFPRLMTERSRTNIRSRPVLTNLPSNVPTTPLLSVYAQKIVAEATDFVKQHN